jgi:hypothetical protein
VHRHDEIGGELTIDAVSENKGGYVDDLRFSIFAAHLHKRYTDQLIGAGKWQK